MGLVRLIGESMDIVRPFVQDTWDAAITARNQPVRHGNGPGQCGVIEAGRWDRVTRIAIIAAVDASVVVSHSMFR